MHHYRARKGVCCTFGFRKAIVTANDGRYFALGSALNSCTSLTAVVLRKPFLRSFSDDDGMNDVLDHFQNEKEGSI